MIDAIERSIHLKAPLERVWKALTDHEEFGTWFRLELHNPFVAGKITHGVVTYPGHEGLGFWARVEAVEEPSLFSFVWPMDDTVDPDDPDLRSKTTLVEFRLESEGDGTRLEIKESGFENLPENKRVQVFRDNEGGWTAQTQNIAHHVE